MLSLIITQNMLVYGIVVVKGDGNNCTLCEVCIHAQPVGLSIRSNMLVEVYIHTYSFVCTFCISCTEFVSKCVFNSCVCVCVCVM